MLGALAALLVAVVVYVLTANQVNSRTTDIARTKSEAAEAEARAAALEPFGQFATVKETRVASVKELARARFDWERLMRELALVLPDRTWLTEVTAATTPEGEDAAASGEASAGAASSAQSGGVSPSVKLVGCAVSQPKVAALMVRLRQLHRAEDVKLAESTEEEASGGGGSPTDSSAQSSSDGCGGRRYKFDVTVTFTPEAGRESGEGKKGVPASLGGGS